MSIKLVSVLRADRFLNISIFVNCSCGKKVTEVSHLGRYFLDQILSTKGTGAFSPVDNIKTLTCLLNYSNISFLDS